MLIQQPHSTLAVGKEQPLQPCASHHRPSRCKTPWKAVGQASGTLQGNQKLTCVMDQPTSMIKQSEGHLCCEPKYWFDRAIRRSPVLWTQKSRKDLVPYPSTPAEPPASCPMGPREDESESVKSPALARSSFVLASSCPAACLCCCCCRCRRCLLTSTTASQKNPKCLAETTPRQDWSHAAMHVPYTKIMYFSQIDANQEVASVRAAQTLDNYLCAAPRVIHCALASLCT